jgi:DNA-binding winged helix-turn-helix (wHTH) protein/tetratricopeptide (TPR) repeat protein
MKEFLQFRLDVVNQCLWQRRDNGDDQRILLTPKAFGVLHYLVEHAGRLVTHDELLDAVWPATHVQPQAVKKLILDIRTVLGDRARKPLYIETLHRRGYRFIAPMREPIFQRHFHSSPKSPGKLVGRDEPLAELREQFEKALARERQIVFITGEPGIGKTALADEFQRQTAVEVPQVRIARGQCVEGYGGNEPYYPMLEALGQLCRGAGGESVIETLASQAPTWLLQLPALVKRDERERLQREVIGATRERMLREIGDALEKIAATAPLILIFEDVQWVDHASVDLIAAVARRRGPLRLMLVATKRPLSAALEHPLKALKDELLVHDLCHDIALRPLTETEIADYIAAASPKGVSPEGLAEVLYQHTEGNPLFMVAALEHMTKRGLADRDDRGWKLKVPLQEIVLEVPQKLRRMIDAQIDAFSPEEQRVLEAASVEGQTFSAAVSAEAADVDREVFEDTCERLSRRQHILDSAGSQKLPDGTQLSRYKFMHALYREACYRRQSPTHRAKLHLNIGNRLEALFANTLTEVAGELAYHFEAASNWTSAVRYLQIRAEIAGRRYAPREAASFLQHALELTRKLPEGERASDEIAILHNLATIYHVSLDIGAVDLYETLADRAAHYGLMDVQMAALIDKAGTLSWISSERCLEALDRALHLCAEQTTALRQARARARCLVQRIWVGGWNSRDAEDFRKALEEIRGSVDRHILAPHLIDYSFTQWISSDYRGAQQSVKEGLALLCEGSDENPYLRIAHWLSEIILPWTLLFSGQWGDALFHIKDEMIIVEKNAGHFRGQTLRVYQAWVHLTAMDFAGVLTICESLIPILEAPERSAWRRLAQVLAGTAETGLGNYDHALSYFFTVRDDMDRRTVTFDWYCRMLLELGIVEVSLAKGDLARAREEAQKFLNTALSTAERTWQGLGWETNARVAMAASDFEQGWDYITRALKTIEDFEVPLAEWRVHATAAELCERAGDTQRAEQHRASSRATIMRLANSLGSDEMLRRIFLSAPAIREILDGAQPQVHKRQRHQANLAMKSG